MMVQLRFCKYVIVCTSYEKEKGRALYKLIFLIARFVGGDMNIQTSSTISK
jgi:hypothetical protein